MSRSVPVPAIFLGAAVVALALGRKRPGIEADQEALARVMRSEVGDVPGLERERLAVASATLNKALEVGETVMDLVTGGTGRWGKQSRTRYAATRIGPTEETLALAEGVIKAGVDWAGGATHWFHPLAQDRLFKAGRIRRSADQVLDDWTRGDKLYTGGARVIPVPGTDPRRVLFLGPPARRS